MAPPNKAKELPGHLAGLTVGRQVAILAVWPLLEQMLGFLVGFVDTAIAGRLSIAAMEAIAVAAYLGWLIILLFGAGGVAASAVVARSIGGRHRRMANLALAQALLMATAMGVLLGLLVLVAARPICSVMNLSGHALDLGTTYLHILAVATPPSGILFVGLACLRAAGDTKSPFVVLALVNAVNALVSITLVFAPAPLGGWGTAGIAAGTAVAWATGAVCTAAVLMGGRRAIRLHWLQLIPRWQMMRRLLRIGIPQFVNSFAMWIGNFIVAVFVGQAGSQLLSGALAAHVIAIRLEAVSYLPGWALAIAAATLAGQYLGMGDVSRARLAVLYCCGIGVAVMGLMGVLFLCIPRQLVLLVTTEPVLLDLAPDLLRICAPVQVFLAVAMIVDQALRGAGDTKSAMLIMTLSTFCIRVPAAYAFCFFFGWGIHGVWMAISGEIVLRAVLFGMYFQYGRWDKVKV